MFSKKCFRCGRKIEKDFEFCPHCGQDFRTMRRNEENEDFGFLGKEDSLFPEIPSMNLGAGMPFGKIIDSLLKQIDTEMKQIDRDIPKMEKIEKKLPLKTSGFSISISTGTGKQPEIKISGFGPDFQKLKQEEIKEIVPKAGITENKARQSAKLPREEAETNVRRLSNKIIYEIKLPGIKNIKDVLINKLENSIEIKAFSDCKVYFKLLPVNLPMIGYKLEKEKLILELKTK